MEIYLPTLETKIVALVGAFRFIAFAIMVVGLIAYAASPRTGNSGLFVALAKSVVIVAAIAYMPLWFPKVEQTFLAIAEYIDPGYNEHPTSASDTVRDSTTTNPEGHEWSWRRINESIYQAVTHAIANILIYVGTLITVPMLILQYVLRWLLYLLTPFMLALFLVPGFAGIGVRFFQQVLAILAWPIGFALTNLVALAIWNDFRAAVGPNPTSVADAAIYSPLLDVIGGLVAAIMLVVGMLSTPVVMQMLFAQGHAFTGASGHPGRMVRSGTDSIRGIESVFRREAVDTRPPPSLGANPSSPPPPPITTGI
jgi:hypothetical protein